MASAKMNHISARHTFSNVSSDNQLSLEKMFSVDLQSLGIQSVKHVAINITGDKIFFSSDGHSSLIFSLRNKSLIAFEGDRVFHDLFWSTDVGRGEILVDYNGATGEVSVFTIDYEGKTLKILIESTISKLIGKPITDDLRLAVTFRVSSGMSLIMIGVNQNLFLVDPFTGMLHQKLEVRK